ncbi:MAG: 16S rRNA pseudouridine(516) synthase RsuA [Gammaproteobacteria bacterium]|nr:16S rRNA pseudouridine(516) synthase RsuA [Gammaproteobacteria bacterium]
MAAFTRLDKRLSHATGLTRSRAQITIRRGQVTVDGTVVRDPAFKVAPQAQVAWRECEVASPGHRYYMLNKPQGVICATSDESHRTVLDLLDIDNKKGLHVAGRLDIDTTGLVLISDDGDWSHRITAPRHKCPKRYRVTLVAPLDPASVAQFAEGMVLRNEAKKTQPAMLEILTPTDVRLTISEGKYHQVKRMFAAIGNHVTALHREAIGALQLDERLALGEYRPLSEAERMLLIA